MAGYDGQFGNKNQNYFYLKRASDNAILFSVKPPQGKFTNYSWDVSSYVGTKVYFQLVDNNSDPGFAWLAVDDINWRGFGPKSFTAITSTDGINWGLPVLTVSSQGNKYDSYSWTAGNARYVKLDITAGYNDNAMIKDLVFNTPKTPWTVSYATASTQQGGYEASKTIDGEFMNDINFWSPTGVAPQWIQYDLGTARSVGCLELFTRNSTLGQKLGPKDFTIQVSANGTNWTTVYTAKNIGETVKKYIFDPVNARYVKLDITSGWNATCQIKEVKIYP